MVVSWQASAVASDALGLRHGAAADRVWFSGESADVMNRVTAVRVDHNRTLHHPLMVSVLRGPTQGIFTLWPEAEAVDVMRLGLAAAAGAWVGGLFLMSRAIGCPLPDAALMALVGLASSAALFWSAVPEVAMFGAVTVLPAIVLAATAFARQRPDWVSVGVVAATLSLTVGNGVTGAIAAVMQHPWRRALQVTVNAVCLILVLCGIQRIVFPSTGVIADHDPDDRPVLRATWLTAPVEPLVPFFLHGMVMPTVATGPALTVQRSWPGSAGVPELLALVAWVGLLVIGATARVAPAAGRLRTFLAAAVGGQLALQLLLGGETFADALYYLPLLIALAAIGLLTTWRRIGLVLAGVLVVTAAINNHGQFMRSAELARAIIAQPAP